MLLLEYRYFPHRPSAVLLGAVICASFVLIAPAAWRILVPQSHIRSVWQLAGFASICLLTLALVTRVLPVLLAMRPTLLTYPSSTLVAASLFIVGGWGLGRDMDLEEHLREERDRALELERAAERAQLMALRAHLDPHFLFNTLNAIAEWCRQDGVVAEAAILRLSKLLRTMLEGAKLGTWSLDNELSLARDLLELHLLRDPGLFDLKMDIEERALGIFVPSMCVVTLVENAVKHGPSRGHRGPLVVRARYDANFVTIEVSNNGPYAGPRPGGNGLPTLRQQLDIAYRGNARLDIRSDGSGTVAILNIPRVASESRSQ